jgi:hypothetical protein
MTYDIIKVNTVFWRWAGLGAICALLMGCQSPALISSELLDRQNILEAQAPFRALSTTTICSQSSCIDKRLTSAEILASTPDGLILVYTDSPRNSIGFFDISNPAKPVGKGRLLLAGEPTSIAIKNNYALVTITTTVKPEQPSGQLIVVDVTSQQVITEHPLPGQPDSIALSPDRQYGAIAIENERSFKINNGDLPQQPAGMVVGLDISAQAPVDWQLTSIDITNLAAQFPGDPEPEYVDINQSNQAVITLQENNHLVLIDLPTSSVINHFSAGSTITQVPPENSASNFALQVSAPREPDGVSWLTNEYIVTADEGDYYGGTDTITIFDLAGSVVWSSRDELRRVIRAIGRQEQTIKEGAQPENIEVATFDNGKTYLFANIERGDVVLVYDASTPTKPQLVQVLDTPKGPEGGLAIPSRSLFVVASEDDHPDGEVRAQIHIFELVKD